MRIQTARLRISHLDIGDAAFILELLNDPDWLRYIGDRGVHNPDEARDWIESGPRASYRRYGFGLNLLALASDHTPIGVCGLLQRDNLDGPDLGFALLPAFRDQGYAQEAAMAVIELARAADRGPSQLYAFLTADNLASRRLLHKLGFVAAGDYRPGSDSESLDLYRLLLRA